MLKDNEIIRGQVPMTKMEVRSVILTYLELEKARNVLEIGGGTGSVTVSMAKAYPHLHITCVERSQEACELIRLNAEKQGVYKQIEVIHAEAPVLTIKKTFDRVYIGGSGVFFGPMMTWLEESCMQSGSLLVGSMLTLENTQNWMDHLLFNPETSSHYSEVEGSQIQANRLETLGRFHHFKAGNPCTVMKAVFTPEIQEEKK